MAEVDTSIYRVQPKSYFDYLQEMAGAEDAKAARERNRLQTTLLQGQVQDATQARAQRNRLTEALQALGAGATDEQRINTLRTNGGFEQADALEKSILERKKVGAQAEKDTAEAEKLKLATLHSNIDRHLQSLAMVNDPQAAAGWLAEGVKAGVMDMNKAQALTGQLQTMNPAQFQAWKQQMAQGGMSLKDQVEQAWKSKGYDLDVQRVQEQARHNKSVEGLTARGQNMADARAREVASATVTKPFEVTGPDGNPMLVRQDRQGNITPVDGYGPKTGSSKPLTDAQAKALGFGSRMRDSEKIISDLEAKGTMTPSLIKQGLEAVPGIGGGLGMLANATIASDEQQQVEQAQRDFLNAILRRESGAVISDQEFASGRKQYFPQPGDSDAVRQQKAKNRRLATQGVLAEVPDGKRDSLSTKSPDIDSLVNKYRSK
jgi:hypothetical protein